MRAERRFEPEVTLGTEVGSVGIWYIRLPPTTVDRMADFCSVCTPKIANAYNRNQTIARDKTAAAPKLVPLKLAAVAAGAGSATSYTQNVIPLQQGN